MEERRKRTIKKSLLGCTLVSMLAMPLMGCGNVSFSYVTKEDGSIEIQGSISYDILIKYEFIQINYDDGTKNSYITEVIGDVAKHYYNIQTDKEVVYYTQFKDEKSSSDDSINSCYFISIEDILIKHNFIKEEYSVDDIDKLYDMCIEEMEKEQDKEYIKKLEFNN